MKKVMLIFPPEWVPTAPYLALPSLTAVLRQNGVEVVQKDINVEMYDHFFTREYLEFTRDRIANRKKELKVKQWEGKATQEDEVVLEMMKFYTKLDLDHHVRKVERRNPCAKTRLSSVDRRRGRFNRSRIPCRSLVLCVSGRTSMDRCTWITSMWGLRPWITISLPAIMR